MTSQDSPVGVGNPTISTASQSQGPGNVSLEGSLATQAEPPFGGLLNQSLHAVATEQSGSADTGSEHGWLAGNENSTEAASGNLLPVVPVEPGDVAVRPAFGKGTGADARRLWVSEALPHVESGSGPKLLPSAEPFGFMQIPDSPDLEVPSLEMLLEPTRNPLTRLPAGQPAMGRLASNGPSMEISQLFGAIGLDPVTTMGPMASFQATMTRSPGDSVATQIQLPLGHVDWADELGNRVQWLVRQNVQVAEMRINPPDLGPIELRVSVQNEQTNLIFASSNVTVREAIEAGLPRLREMLSDQGLQQVEVSIAQQSFSGHQGGGFSRNSDDRSDRDGPGEFPGEEEPTINREVEFSPALRRVDFFA